MAVFEATKTLYLQVGVLPLIIVDRPEKFEVEP